MRQKSERHQDAVERTIKDIRRRTRKVFVRINGETYYLWRAVDHEGEVLRDTRVDVSRRL